MGISDEDITKMLYDSGNSAGDLYKQAGNSIVVDVLRELFRKMFIDIDEDPGDSKQLF
jgi:site-specific DNA-cytosine methylase